jgi:hypothetical protein
MLSPDQFRVNEAWVAITVNDAFIYVKDEPHDIYVLLDAASTYVFGHVLARAVDEAPDAKEVEALFRKAWSEKRQWAKKLIIPTGFTAAHVFREQAEKNGLACTEVPLGDLVPIVGPLKESFSAHISRSGS